MIKDTTFYESRHSIGFDDIGPSQSEKLALAEKRNIFVAVSDVEDREYISAMLETDGFEDTPFADGYHLVEHIADSILDGSEKDERRPKLIIADAVLPGCTGMSLLSGLRDLHWRTPIVLLTKHDQRLSRPRTWNYGVTAVFYKPFDIDELCAFASLVMEPRDEEEEAETIRLARGTARIKAPEWVD